MGRDEGEVVIRLNFAAPPPMTTHTQAIALCPMSLGIQWPAGSAYGGGGGWEGGGEAAGQLTQMGEMRTNSSQWETGV